MKKLAPESLTVHTLAIKRAAHLKQEMDKYSFAGDVDEQLSLVGQAAEELGLAPYYLYRQKNMAGIWKMSDMQDMDWNVSIIF